MLILNRIEKNDRDMLLWFVAEIAIILSMVLATISEYGTYLKPGSNYSIVLVISIWMLVTLVSSTYIIICTAFVVKSTIHDRCYSTKKFDDLGNMLTILAAIFIISNMSYTLATMGYISILCNICLLLYGVCSIKVVNVLDKLCRETLEAN